MKESISTILGFLSAVIVSAALLTMYVWQTDTSGLCCRNGYFLLVLIMQLGASVFAAMIALPAFLFLRRIKLVRWWSAMPVGIIIGIIIAYESAYPKGSDIDRILGWGIIGGISAFVFWVVWRKGKIKAEKSG